MKYLAPSMLAILCIFATACIPFPPTGPGSPVPNTFNYTINEVQTPTSVEELPSIIVQLTSTTGSSLSQNRIAEIFNDIQLWLESQGLNVNGVEPCSCGDPTIQKFDVSPRAAPVDLEGVVRSLSERDEGDADVEADKNFLFNSFYAMNGNFETNLYNANQPINVENQNTVNIAVIDTGIDLNHFAQQNNWLFNTTDINSKCANNAASQTTGWNFISKNENIQDLNGHGTAVTKIITEELTDTDTPYKILPVVAFDREGSGTYWSILCAFNYIKTIPSINFVNASFGGNLFDVVDILDEFSSPVQIYIRTLNDLERNGTIVVASAGNTDTNTDSPGNAHFPSGFFNENILSVAGFQGDFEEIDGLDKHPFSNYGTKSIDVFAKYEGYEFTSQINGNTNNYTLNGTSFSAAAVTSMLANEYYVNPSNPKQFIGQVIKERVMLKQLQNYSKYGAVMELKN